MRSTAISRPLAWKVVVVCTLAVVFVLAGCSGITDTEQEPPTGEEAAERLSGAGVYNATIVIETEMDGETFVQQINSTRDPTNGRYYQVAENNGIKQVSISNGTKTWRYEPATNNVTVTRIESDTEANATDRVKSLFDSIETDTDDDTTPMIPSIQLFPALTAQSSGSSPASGSDIGTFQRPVNVTYEGTETVLGRETYVINVQSAGETDRMMEQTQYYDTEHLVPIKANYTFEFSRNGENSTVSGERRMKDVNFDVAVDEDIFEFDIPENATVTRPGENFEQYESYDALTAASERQVPDPEVPESVTFDSGTVSDEGLSLRYSDGADTISVTRRESGRLREDSEQIVRDDRTYYYSQAFSSDVLRWRCSDTTYTIYDNSGLDRDELLAIGESVQCPAD